MDKRIFSLGLVMLALGLGINQYLSITESVGKPGMSDKEKIVLEQNEQLNSNLSTLFQSVGAFGFLIFLISFGLKRKKKNGAGKAITQKPAETG